MSDHLHVATTPHLHEHEHEAETSLAFPADAENLLFTLVDELRRGELSPRYDSTAGEVEALEERYGLRDVFQRLGARAPDVGPAEYAALARAFADRYESLPVTYVRYEHAHNGHDHEGHDCGKIHGPLRRRLDNLEEKALGKIGSRRARTLAAAAFRLGALAFCPGDDILAVGAQTYGAVSGHVGNGGRHEELALLPKRPQLDFELEEGQRRAKVSLPLDAPAAHSDIPATRAGDALRTRVADDGPAQDAARNARLAKEAAMRPEKSRRRRRIVALGALAMAALGIGASDVAHHEAAPRPGAAVSPAAPEKPEIPHRHADQAPPLAQPVTIKEGDSQWKIMSRRAKKAGSGDVPLVNAATAYTAAINAGTYPDPAVITPGDALRVPSPATLKRFATALSSPEEAPGLARALQQLNAQNTYGSSRAKQIAQQVTSLLEAQER
jgi:hypothetical protein